MDERYLKALIYTISNINNPVETYVGSTINFLKRKNKHNSDCKKNSNILIYKKINNDWNNWIFTIYEEYPCNNKTELTKREGQIIKQIGTLNRRIAGRDKKEYYKDNIDKRKQQMREYNKNNKNKLKEYYKQYYINKKSLKEVKKDEEKAE